MSRAPIVLGALGVAVGLVIAFVLFRGSGAGEIGFGARGYTVQSDSVVQVVFEVRKDPARTALCTVRARDRDGTEVGNAVVRVGPSSGRSSVVTYDLQTNARANTGEVPAC